MSVCIVAELGINHGGNPGIAEEMIRLAAMVGCDAVKVQSFRCEDFLPEGHPDWDLFHRCEIWPWLDRLADRAHREGLLFGVTPQSVEGVREAVEAGADYLKNGSDSLLRRDMIDAMLDTGLPVWVSTGMADSAEINRIPDEARLMLCTSLYPCPDDQAALSRLAWVQYKGFSDHTEGIVAASVAAAFFTLWGTDGPMIEKHFTLYKREDGPDHWFSADPEEMGEMVDAVRRVETLVTGRTGFQPGEAEGREKWRTTPESPLRI